MLEHESRLPRAPTLLHETLENSSFSARAGEPALFPATADLSAKFDAVVSELEDDPRLDVVAIQRREARSAVRSPWPNHVDPRIRDVYRARGITEPYRHQTDALEAVHAGRDLVLSTPTASGKSLCFRVPILDAILRDPAARALCLFPTKALSRDQMTGLRNLVDPHGDLATAVGTGVYDGDTPPDARRAVRARAHVVATNPDMLHRGLLPNHDGWASLLARLRFVVLDEVHTYRGVFGSHVANVLRRLWRVCEFYGSRPQVIACSATIANPRELTARLIGRDPDGITLVDRSDAPRGPRTFVVANPAVVDRITGVRRDYLKVARVVSDRLRRAAVPTLVFCRTRKAVELLTRYLREDEAGLRSDRFGAAEGPVDPARVDRAETSIRGYRGGYLPERRREVEAALRDGNARLVASTSALELGMDIGGLDAVVLAGYPGTRAATVQRAGRAGRRGDPALTVLTLSSRPIDQFVAASPSFLFDEPPEHARIDPDNPEVLVPHVRCAAYELPFEQGQTLAGLPAEDTTLALEYLARAAVLFRQDGSEGQPSRYFAAGDAFPADHVDLRGTIEENFTVIEMREGFAEHGRILAEVDFEDAPLYLHPGAIYPIESKTYEVERLDWENRKAYVRDVRSHYYTEAITKTRVRLLDPDKGADTNPPEEELHGVGYAHLVRSVPGFKKLRFRTHENIGFGPINLPDLELHTVAAFWTFPESLLALLSAPEARSAAALAAAHALHHVAAMVCMCDVADLGHAVAAGHDGAWAPVSRTARGAAAGAVAELVASGVPTLYLYDTAPGGAGLANQIHRLGRAFMERVASMVAGCGCRAGCPTCIGAREDLGGRDVKTDAVEVLRNLRADEPLEVRP